MTHTDNLNNILQLSVRFAMGTRSEFITPEHFLMALMRVPFFVEGITVYGDGADKMDEKINQYVSSITPVPDTINYDPKFSALFNKAMETAKKDIEDNLFQVLKISHVVNAMFDLENSEAAYLLNEHIYEREPFITYLSHCDIHNVITIKYNDDTISIEINARTFDNSFDDDDDDTDLGINHPDLYDKYFVDIKFCPLDPGPLIGRKKERDRILQVLCRKTRHNVLLIGEPGVGKTKLVDEVTNWLAKGKDLPKRMKNKLMVKLNTSSIIAAQQYKGGAEAEIDNAFKLLITSNFDGAIVYIDNLHILCSNGSNNNDSYDIANALVPYLDNEKLMFICCDTWDGYTRRVSNAKNLLRRFQMIEVKEPSADETVEIVYLKKKDFEEFHGVRYSDETIRHAVEQAGKLINDRYQPEKSIDVIDEAGALLEIESNKTDKKVKDKEVTKDVINMAIAKILKVESDALIDDNERLAHLYDNISSQLFGQDEAVRQVVESIQMSKAGLTDDDKPIASMLFIGPTGVGKTELCRILAKEMGVSLVRFDMSEYREAHTIAKLIGSPAGYVGYDDGGLLTTAIRKSPNCVLLLDEIEKAHSDIYDILLQVMDYARLTDNHGQKADFHNVILIMTSNAGAQYASQASVGFSGGVTRGDAMLQQVKKTFKPEFLNRLSTTVVFHDMDKTMARNILNKKIGLLMEKTSSRNVRLTLSDAAFNYLLDKGFTKEYGAREMDRIINKLLKPLLVKEILFGKLKDGGDTTIDLRDDKLVIAPNKKQPKKTPARNAGKTSAKG